MIRVLFVCLGNICRSPMAEAVFQHMIDTEGLSDRISIDSAGTGNWHSGNPAHPGTRQVLAAHGISYTGRARQVTRPDLREFDYVVAMDDDNVADLRLLDRHLDGRLYRLLEFAPAGAPRNVPDPYYEHNFDAVYELVTAGCQGLLQHLRATHDL